MPDSPSYVNLGTGVVANGAGNLAPVRGARGTAAALVLAGCVLILAIVGLASWPLVLAWLAAALLVGSIWERLSPPWRLGLAVGLLAACVLLTWEGGLFFIPS